LIYSIQNNLGFAFSYANFLIIQSFLGLLIFSAGNISRIKRIPFAEVYNIFGYSVTLVTLYVLTFQSNLQEWHGKGNWVYLSISLVLLVMVILAILEQTAYYFKSKVGRLELSTLAAVLLCNVFLLANPEAVSLNTVFANAALAIFALLNIYLGVEIQKPLIFNMGIFIFVIFILTRFVDAVWKLREKSLFFIFGGIVILSLGVFLEKQRRKIVERMNKNE